MNTRIGKQDCKKCMWYESCKDSGEMCRNCEDYSPLKQDQRERSQYIDDLDDRQQEYNSIVREFEDCDEY